MQIQNKFEKFLILLSSAALAAIGMLGIKIKEDEKKLVAIGDNLDNYNASIIGTLDLQKEIMAGREALLEKISKAQAPDTTKTVTTQTVVPGKVVKQTVPVSSSKKTKTS